MVGSERWGYSRELKPLKPFQLETSQSETFFICLFLSCAGSEEAGFISGRLPEAAPLVAIATVLRYVVCSFQPGDCGDCGGTSFPCFLSVLCGRKAF
ncbi:unnamed protein product [Rangifer tarandus platyrhynchus]|uniref:Uncharacterized protein n=1 Tax=Rangifer tarandus platyrhynchus TaxID=3082113 RepID=A0AC59ZW54_RANTA